MEKNLEKTLVIANINPESCGRIAFTTFYVVEQIDDVLKVVPLWDEGHPDDFVGYMGFWADNLHSIKVDDVWVFPTSVSETKEKIFKRMGLDYRFHKDDNAMVRLANKLQMDKINITYEGEPAEGTWFSCCRVSFVKNILPDGLHIYSLRAADEDDSQPASIEDFVRVNHFGDILTDKTLPVPVQLEVEPGMLDD